MRTLAAGLTVTLLGCQPLTWQGTWAGSVTLNDGRMPLSAAGALTVSTGAGTPAALLFGFKGTRSGSATEFSCPQVFSTASQTATTASLAGGGTCAMQASPADGCTYELSFTSGDFTLASDTLTGKGSGRLNAACAGMGNAVTDFGFMLTATDRK